MEEAQGSSPCSSTPIYLAKMKQNWPRPSTCRLRRSAGRWRTRWRTRQREAGEAAIVRFNVGVEVEAEVVMSRWRDVDALASEKGPFIRTVTRTGHLRSIDLNR